MLRTSFQKNTGRSAFDIPVFVILLERDAARRRHVHDNIMPRLPTARIVSAIDYQSGALAKCLANNEIIVERSSYVTIADPKLACTISHIRVWEAIMKERMPYAIVLEDDVAILDDFEIELNQIKSQLDDSCDFVHLYVHRNFQNGFAIEKAKPNCSLVRYVPPYGRSAYLLSANGASKLVAAFRKVNAHGDEMVSALAARGEIEMKCAMGRLIDNLGQLCSHYEGELFRSNVHLFG